MVTPGIETPVMAASVILSKEGSGITAVIISPVTITPVIITGVFLSPSRIW